MAPTRTPVQDQILAVDIGATNVKFCHVDIHGELLEGVRRRPTPYPCSPERLIEALGRTDREPAPVRAWASAFPVSSSTATSCARATSRDPGE